MKTLHLVVLSVVIVSMIFAPPIIIQMVNSKTFYLGSSSHGNTKGTTSKSIKSVGGGASSSIGNTTLNNKVIMINFDDSYKTQVLYAKPILDQYGFKATFFEVCGWVGKDGQRQTWQDVAAIQRDGNAIASHTMTHAHLNSVSTNKLYYELGYANNALQIMATKYLYSDILLIWGQAIKQWLM